MKPIKVTYKDGPVDRPALWVETLYIRYEGAQAIIIDQETKKPLKTSIDDLVVVEPLGIYYANSRS